ncbi:MAG TPA: N-acetylmuramoyl-L-alanine amidase [Chitinophagaceae bacterium]|nr:N-acetylmuramoyl-L-alanine amidase [Chitinophagaceae bacterium]
MKALLFAAGLLAIMGAAAQESAQKFFMAKTTGALPFLEYGLGDDRLGGAKMTFLDSNIVLKVIDSFGIDYKVQLSKFHTAWIDKHSVQRLPGKQPAPWHLTGSWKVSGDSAYDYVAIAVDEKLPYRSQQQINPSRLVVDIYGATSNSNWITQLSTSKEIKNVYYDQVEDDVFRVSIELKHTQHWGHSIYYDSTGKRLVIQVKRPPSPDIKKLRIAIDAGHGGENAGATGINSGILEKDYTLKIAKELQSTLKKAGVVHTFMTRTKDTTLDMPQRIQMLKIYQPDILISIHLNSAGIDSVKGTSTYYRYIGFRPLTTAILKQMLQLGLKEYGNVGSFNFSLSGPTAYPNCLVEVAFLSNPQDEKKILDPKFHKAVAGKIYLGIKDWLQAIK